MTPGIALTIIAAYLLFLCISLAMALTDIADGLEYKD